MFKRVRESFTSTPTAPRLNTRPLPEIGSPAPPPTPAIGLMSPRAAPTTMMTPKPVKVPHSRTPSSSQDSGYSTSPEVPTVRRRTRTSSNAVPKKGILKPSTTPVIVRTALIPQDGYASSPEIQKPARLSSFNGDALRPRAHTTGSITPPATLHWKLLPYNARFSKGRLHFDLTQNVEDIRLGPANARATAGPRPLSTLERNKPASVPQLTRMVIHCADLPLWPVHIECPGGVRCVDVFQRIQETFDVVLTRNDRETHRARLRECEEALDARVRRTPGYEPCPKGLRRVDLLKTKTVFVGLDWVPPDEKHPDGYWALKLAHAYF
ncbi:hypothetical protein FA95DRAFT_1503107 [Auriscalpium vulgare]|uniref:Uncharacterized protein n=1 Tax=Auriscalpium vulgare TaxID=40419 RepID=A0ACB8R828_9AGAM|nr:hypothetical protein FA95DRAFT_1503107 [Auriscalpium vulgare]